MRTVNLQDYMILEMLSQEIKELLQQKPKECEKKVMMALMKYPDAPQPQNLLGIIAEKKDDRLLAMKHYRAAWALAPNYRPSRENIDRLVEMEYSQQCYFNDQDVEDMEKRKKQKESHIIRRKMR